MKKITSIIAIALVAMLSFTSCSKEKQLEKRLVKKEGKWNLANYSEKYYEDGDLVGDYSFANAGTFTFEKDGKGSYVFNVAGSTDSGNFTWSNTENTITIDAMVYNIVENEKKSISFTVTESETIGGVTYADEFTYLLKR